jgi:hypothetical protein
MPGNRPKSVSKDAMPQRCSIDRERRWEQSDLGRQPHEGQQSDPRERHRVYSRQRIVEPPLGATMVPGVSVDRVEQDEIR